MSRIGKEPIIIPAGVTVSIEGSEVKVAGPKGQLSLNIRPEVKVEVLDNKIQVSVKRKDPFVRSLFGTSRNIIANLVEGVTVGFTKNLKIIGTGYRAQMEGNVLVLNLGFSHPIKFTTPEGIKIETPEKDSIIVTGIDKVVVGQTAATIRDYYKPEPYKGKGIRYEGEYVRKKAGKTGKAGAAGS
jgi:large subunit ribosomal protein L6